MSPLPPTSASGWRPTLLALGWGLAAALAWDATMGDLAVARWFGTADGFAARNAFWAEQVLHNGLRWVSAAVLLWMLYDLWRPWRPSDGPSRRERAWALGGVVLALLIVPAIKNASRTSCPWSLAEFGSVATWVSHWDWGVGDGGPGRCFPSGHSVGSFAFFGLVWAWWRTPRVQRWMLAGVLLAGLLGSVAQWARGAHFVSHSLWAALGCALVTGVWQRWGEARVARASRAPTPPRSASAIPD
jgi:membrane-associated PAP2 superfamily phosphatase